MVSDTAWWKSAVIYQIYPRSFQDANGDGTGDLPGITRRLSYLQGLGIDAAWISPIYPSPMKDGGYDVADYCAIDPLFGTLADFDTLVAEAHRLGLKLILDFVPNHTSDQHPWFMESRRSRENAKRDWYIWRDSKPDGSPPNNWISNFGGPAWSFDDTTGQWFLHSFLPEQPDLDWRNPAVQAAMLDALRFWLRRGVDGFRVDVMWLMVKDAALRDNPPNPDWRPGQPEINRLLQVYNADQPEVHDVVAAMRRVLDSFGERVLIGEIYLPLDRLVTYYGAHLSGAQLPFNFKLIQTPWTAGAVADLATTYEGLLPPGGWPNWVLGNHDQPRLAGRIGDAQARVAAMLLLTLRGTPTMFYGDELGIGRIAIPPEAVRDPWERNEPGHGFGRDPERTPMMWDASANAGFSSDTPWLPLDPLSAEKNVAALTADPTSILSLYRRLLALRRASIALREGAFRLLSAADDVLVYERVTDGERVVIALNFADGDRALPTLDALAGARHLLSTTAGEADAGRLRANEGVVYRQG